MGRVRTSVLRSRVPWRRRAFLDPAALRYWLAVAAVAVVSTALVHRSLNDAAAVRARWGPTTDVVVTTEAVRAGDPLNGAVTVVRWPRSLAPTGALSQTDARHRADADLDAGSPITDALVRDPERTRTTERHVAVEAVDPGLEAGDRVDVWATTDPTLVEGAASSDGPVASAARVVRTTGDQIVLAVEADRVAELAQAAALSQLTLAVVP